MTKEYIYIFSLKPLKKRGLKQQNQRKPEAKLKTTQMGFPGKQHKDRANMHIHENHKSHKGS